MQAPGKGMGHFAPERAKATQKNPGKDAGVSL
jgi:hypothetical protein